MSLLSTKVINMRKEVDK